MRLEGKVIPVAHGEAIVCEIPMGILKLVVIANIPDEGTEAVVYVKIRPMDDRRTSKPRRKVGQKEPEVLQARPTTVYETV